MRVWAEVVCPIETSVVEAVLRFEQPGSGSDSIDHGGVYVDDVAFGIR